MEDEKKMSLGKIIVIAILCFLLIATGIYYCLAAGVTQHGVTTATSTTNSSLTVPSGPPAGASGINDK